MPILENISDAVSAWGDSLLEISNAYENSGIEKATSVAGGVLDSLYGYNLGPVLFKPTLSGGSQTFRLTREGALSYFVGQNPVYPHDSGFGIKFWRKVSAEASAVFTMRQLQCGWVG